MKDLLSKQCIPCSIDSEPLTIEEVNLYLEKIDQDWKLAEDGRIEKNFKFKNFKEALNFTNLVGELADQEGHHPSLILAWGLVRVRIWTNNIQGLHENDFILAAKIDQLKR
ncbi:MAG TPA: 4a-hydroxytetrahydrobiopterin dehydratase [Tissierellaceae bacterium]|nr:4a-hydroxytetrahydrobiopterin dehydratase [Tissierellaceae bacterium]